MKLPRKLNPGTRRESGLTLLETLVALAILGTIVVIFLGGIIGTTKAASVADEQTTAESLAQSQMEWAQNVTYIASPTQYTPSPIPGGKDYLSYSANITATPVNATDNGIQKVTVTIRRSGKLIYTLEDYKVDR